MGVPFRLPQLWQPPNQKRPIPHTPSARPAHVATFINNNLHAAEEASKKHGVPVSVILAQSALESNWGRSVKGNAFFGVKGTSGTAGGIKFATKEAGRGGRLHGTHGTFRAFDSYAEAADDYGRVISPGARYQGAMAVAGNPLAMVDSIAAAGYATDPNYAAKVKATIRSQHLTDYDRP